MRKNAIGMRLLVVLVISLTLTAGYAQALPGVYASGPGVRRSHPSRT